MGRSKAQRARTQSHLAGIPNAAIGSQTFANNREMVINRRAYVDKWLELIDRWTLNRIRWEGLPDTVDERWLERTLTHFGYALWWNGNDANTGLEYNSEPIHMATKCVLQGPPDIYDNRHQYMAIGTNYSYQVPEGEGVVIWNSTTRRQTWQVLVQYANDLADLDFLMRTNRNQQRWTSIIAGKETAINDAERILQSLDAGEPAIITTNDISDKVGIINLSMDVPYKQADFHDDKESVLSELYSFLGIVNVGRDKASYMNYSETEMSNDAIARVREDLLWPRRQAAEQINAKWGLNVSVHWRDEEFQSINSEEEEVTEEVASTEEKSE